jgi:hypothetical protein
VSAETGAERSEAEISADERRGRVWRAASAPGCARRRIFDARLAVTPAHHGVQEFATANEKAFAGLGFSATAASSA